MRVRILVILGALALSLGMVGIALTLAQGAVAPQPGADAEANREASASTAAEANATFVPRQALEFTAPVVISAPLFAGIDQFTEFAYLIDPDTGENFPLFDGVEVWGAAFDNDNNRVFFVRGAALYQWPLDGEPELLGNIQSVVVEGFLAMVGLAYGEGTLYGIRNISSEGDPEGLYSIDPDTLDATLITDYNEVPGLVDLGGLDFDHETGTLYGTNDTPATRGLVEVSLDGEITVVAPYPEGQSDLDGLAIGDGRAYLIPDEPGQIYVFDFATMTYTTPISNPWTTSETFAGGAWVEPNVPAPKYMPFVAGSPLD
jgi:hypothetical protein